MKYKVIGLEWEMGGVRNGVEDGVLISFYFFVCSAEMYEYLYLNNEI